nr:MAG TPA: hypothetical protein [Caudoviricetes sp.]
MKEELSFYKFDINIKMNCLTFNMAIWYNKPQRE